METDTTEMLEGAGAWPLQSILAARIDESQPFSVTLTFADGYCVTVSLAGRGVGPPAVVLRDPSLFQQLYVDHEFGTITWPNGYDLDPDRLRMLAMEQHPDDPAAVPAPLR
jgi:hypothetical protein